MRFEDYTPSQQKAIVSQGTNIIVSAGAGSGKTQVLTERVVHFVKNEHYKLNEFLILTFTNLAAGEMKNRIRKALKKENLKEANNVDFSDICTFDSYSLSLVKKYHFLLKVSPNISIVDSNIIDVRKRRIIERLFEQEYEKNSEVFQSMIERFCFKDDDVLRKLVLTFYNKSLLQIDTDSYLNQFLDHYYSEEMMNFFKQEIIDLLKEKRTVIEHLVNLLPNEYIVSKEEDETLRELYKDLIEPLIKAETYNALINSLPEALPSYTLKKGHPEAGEIKNKVTKKLKEFVEYKNSLPQNEEELLQYFLSCRPFAEIIINMMKELDKDIKIFKDKYQTYEFQDIAKMALFLVKNNEEIRLSLKNQYRMIMVDEYQDTSLLQETFINLIENNNVYMVGDVKQSIYRFRNARCDIFVNKYNKYKANDGGMAIDLNANFRSRKEVLEDINFIFKQIMSDECGEANYKKEHMIEYGNKDYLKAGSKQDSSHLDFLVYEKVNALETPELEANLVARDIINKINNKYPVMDYIEDEDGHRTPILRPCRISDFCILMDRGATFETFAKVFDSYKIPLHVENDEDISCNDIVIVLTNILRLIKAVLTNDYGSMDFIKAFLSVARSFLFAYDDDRLLDICSNKTFYEDPIMEDLRNIVFKYDYLSTSQLFEKVIFSLNIHHRSISIGNVDKNEQYLNTFLSMFKSMSQLDYSIDDFILFMECVDEYELSITLSSSGSSIDSVQIMNIHKSKGLEFNIIYYCGLNKQFNRMEMKDAFSYSYRYGLILPPEDTKQTHILKDLNSRHEVKEDLSERIRLFYVALTRTREKMICVLPSVLYASIKQESNIRNLRDFYRLYNLKALSKIEQFALIHEGLINKEINFGVFYMLAYKIQYDLPLRFLRLSNEEKLKVSLVDIENWKNEELSHQKAINEYISNYSNIFIYSENVIKYCFEQVVKKQIKPEFFIDLLLMYGFYLKNEDGLSLILEKNTTEVELPEIIFADHNISLLYNFDGKNFSAGKMLFELTLKGVINKEDFKRYLNLLSLELKPQALNLLEEGKLLSFSADILTNPIFEYDKDQAKKEFLQKIKVSFQSSYIDLKDLQTLINIYFKEIPFEKEIFIAIKKLINRELSIDSLEQAIKLMGYDINPLSHKFFVDACNGKASIDDIEKFFLKDFFDSFSITPRLLDALMTNEKFMHQSIMQKFYLMFVNGEIDLPKFIDYISGFNFELNHAFTKLSLLEQKSFSIEDIEEVVTENNIYDSFLEESLSFGDFISPFINYHKFKKYIVDLSFDKPQLSSDKVIEKLDKLQIENVEINYHVVDQIRPSKQISFDTDKGALEFGSQLHLAMEITDFKNPDYSILDNSTAHHLKKFLNSDLCQNIQNGVIYKEYEFYDEVDSVSGIIDLFIVYDDHIDIIDYKTKHIDDPSYDEQLSIYRRFIKRKYSLEVRTFLYSLIDGVYRETLK